jgi:hypothetical protein
LKVASARTKTCAANDSNMQAIAVPQHLHAIISFFGHEDVPRHVKGDTRGRLELAVA